MPDETLTDTDQSAPSHEGSPPAERPAPWRPLIRPYLVKLGAKVAADGAKHHSISLPVGPVNILASPLDQDIALRISEDRDFDKQSHELVADALGLAIGIADGLRRFEGAEGGARQTIRKGLDQVLGYAYRLSHQMTAESRRLRENGDPDASNELLSARSQLNSLVERSEKIAPALAEMPAGPPTSGRFVYEWDSSGSGTKDTPGKPRPVPGAVNRSKPTGTAKQRVILAALVVVLGVILTSLWLNRDRRLEDFNPADFPAVPGIEMVVNRSPVLLVVVSDDAWNGMSPREKKQAVSTVAVKISAAGYKRAEFRSRKSSRLAVWSGGEKIEISP